MFPSQRVGLGCGTGELTNQQTGKRPRVSTDTEGTSAGSGAVCCWRPGARSGAQLCWCAEGWWAGFPTSWVNPKVPRHAGFPRGEHRGSRHRFL